MVDRFEDTESAVQATNPATASRWWICHLGVALSIPAMAVLLIPRSTQALTLLANFLVWLYFIGIFVSVLGSLYGYHAEADALKAAGSEWVPGKWWWTAGHILLTPYFVAPLYLIDRWLHVGLPWSQLKFW